MKNKKFVIRFLSAITLVMVLISFCSCGRSKSSYEAEIEELNYRINELENKLDNIQDIAQEGSYEAMNAEGEDYYYLNDAVSSLYYKFDEIENAATY